MSGLLTEDEIMKVVVALGRGQESFTEDDATKAVQWAHDTLVGKMCLELVLEGRVNLAVREDGEVCLVPTNRPSP